MTPAARPLTPAERRAPAEEQRPEPSRDAGAEESSIRETELPDCPVDITNTTVAVIAEAQSVTMIFRLDDPSDVAALDGLRLRVRALADRYRREPIVLGEPGGRLERTASRDGVGQPALTPPGGVTSGSANRATAQARRVDVAGDRQTIGASSEYSVVVQDTSDGAKIVITAKNPAELDLLRARLTQDAQVMTQSGSCPW